MCATGSHSSALLSPLAAAAPALDVKAAAAALALPAPQPAARQRSLALALGVELPAASLDNALTQLESRHSQMRPPTTPSPAGEARRTSATRATPRAQARGPPAAPHKGVHVLLNTMPVSPAFYLLGVYE